MIAAALVALVAVLQISFMVIEMFLWTKPFGLRAFRQTQAQANASRVLAANQGLYNGLLAGGLLFGLWRGSLDVTAAFLGAILIAGLYGGATASRTIWLVQALPAALALAFVLLG